MQSSREQIKESYIVNNIEDRKTSQVQTRKKFNFLENHKTNNTRKRKTELEFQDNI